MSNNFSSLVRLGSDPEIRTIPSGQSILNFSAASTTGYGANKKTLWVRCNVWGDRGAKIQPYLKKGGQIVVSGELSQSEYQANDGTTKTSLELNVNSIDLVSDGQQHAPAQQATQQPAQQPAAQQNNSSQNGMHGGFDDDIPFMSLNPLIKAHVI